VRLLIDTHVLLWWLDNDPRLSARSRTLIGAGENAVVVSVVSIWEIAIKAGLGQLEVPPDLRSYLQGQIARNRFVLLPVLLAHAVAVRDLPPHHRDPFDRMLIAQSRTERLSLLSRDTRMKAYEVDVLW
jgi:PIN domain nuclease of toxin-antitoxin system